MRRMMASASALKRTDAHGTRAPLVAVLVFVLVFVVLLGLPACGEPPASHGGPVRDYVSLVDHLRTAGATVVPQTAQPTPTVPPGERSSSFMSVPVIPITVDGAPVSVYEYADEAVTNAEAARISPDGTTFKPGNGASGATVDWVGPPHFYESGRIIVLYVGTNTAIETLLQQQLGTQFAGQAG